MFFFLIYKLCKSAVHSVSELCTKKQLICKNGAALFKIVSVKKF